MQDQDLIVDEVNSAANRWNSYDIPDEVDPLGIEVRSDMDGTAREFVLTMTVGGPTIRVNVTRGIVKGSWGGSDHTAPIDNADFTDSYHQRLLNSWQAQK
jgi:hypothetical protein